MPIIYLSPSTQDWNAYVTGSGSEEYHMNRLADALEPYLLSNGIRYRRNRPDMTAGSSIREANRDYYDLYLALHSNAAPEGRYGEARGIIAFYYPGSAQGERAAELIADALNSVLFPEMQTVVLLETMAGKGTEIGRSFEELRAIIDRVTLSEKLGVCFDTCHVWDAGYDIVGDLDGVLTRFDAIIGLDRLYAVHFNDSKNPCGSHKDRHEKLGQGFLGTDAMKRIALHPALQNKPFILETPNDDQGYIDEIRTVLSWME